MKKTKVCILQFGLSYGGTDTFIINICKYIDKSKFDVTVLNPASTSKLRERENEILSAGVPIYHTDEMYTVKGKFKHLWNMYKFLKANKFDTFHTNVDLFNGPQLLVAKLAGVPNRIGHSHNTQQARQLVGERMPFGVVIYQKLMRWMCRKFATKFVACSEEAMEFLYPGVDWKNERYPQIIYNGIELEKFQTSFDFEKKKRDLGLTKPLHIVVVGHIGLQKNPGKTLEIFNEICKRRGDIDLIWIGKGEMEEEIKHKAKSLGIYDRIKFLGHRSDVNEIMQISDLFLFPSLFEGLGIVMIEAQAAGLPCVASSEVPTLADCGRTVYHQLNEPAEEWADSIEELIDKEKYLDLNQEKLKKFSIKNTVKQIQIIYNR